MTDNRIFVRNKRSINAYCVGVICIRATKDTNNHLFCNNNAVTIASKCIEIIRFCMCSLVFSNFSSQERSGNTYVTLCVCLLRLSPSHLKIEIFPIYKVYINIGYTKQLLLLL